MFKKLFVILSLLLSLAFVWAQGVETFANSTATASYLDGSFTGDEGFTWEYGHSRDEGDYAITGNGLMLRRASDSYLQATIPGGVGSFSFEYRKAFTGSSERQLEVYVDGVVMGTSSVYGTSSVEETSVYIMTVVIDTEDDVEVKIKNVGSTTSNRQTVIDNISWTAPGEVPPPTPTINVSGTLTNFTYEFNDGPSAEQSFTVSGSNLIGNINISAPDNYEISLVSGGPFSSSIELTENDGVVENTDIYVRLIAGLAVGTYNGEIIEISSDDASKTVICNGEVTAPLIIPEGLIHYWNFNKNVPTTNQNWDEPIKATGDTGELTYVFSIAKSFTGSTLNGIEGEDHGGSFSPEAGAEEEDDYANNGKYFDLIVPTTGYENIELSYATRGSGSSGYGTGFKTHEIQYSTDGGNNFTLFETIDGRNVTTWSVQTIDFSSVIGANDNPNFVIRVVLDGATGASGNNRFDNIRIMGDDLGGGDPPVPVELSSFTATISALNYVTLTWVTQTETGLRGYYVFRAPANDLANAQIVSPMIESMNSSQQQSYVYEDRELFDSGTYYYWLQANDLDGSSAFHGPVSIVYNSMGEHSTPEIPLVTQLHSVYPNPFNPTVFIPFSLAHDGAVSFKIYNSRGQMVKHFDLGTKSAGQHRISWDGTDYNGKSLANGVYHIMMSTQDQVYQTKAALLK